MDAISKRGKKKPISRNPVFDGACIVKDMAIGAWNAGNKTIENAIDAGMEKFFPDGGTLDKFNEATMNFINELGEAKEGDEPEIILVDGKEITREEYEKLDLTKKTEVTIQKPSGKEVTRVTRPARSNNDVAIARDSENEKVVTLLFPDGKGEYGT